MFSRSRWPADTCAHCTTGRVRAQRSSTISVAKPVAPTMPTALDWPALWINSPGGFSADAVVKREELTGLYLLIEEWHAWNPSSNEEESEAHKKHLQEQKSVERMIQVEELNEPRHRERRHKRQATTSTWGKVPKLDNASYCDGKKRTDEGRTLSCTNPLS